MFLAASDFLFKWFSCYVILLWASRSKMTTCWLLSLVWKLLAATRPMEINRNCQHHCYCPCRFASSINVDKCQCKDDTLQTENWLRAFSKETKKGDGFLPFFFFFFFFPLHFSFVSQPLYSLCTLILIYLTVLSKYFGQQFLMEPCLRPYGHVFTEGNLCWIICCLVFFLKFSYLRRWLLALEGSSRALFSVHLQIKQ